MGSHRRPTDRRALRALTAAAALACLGMVVGALSQTSAAWQDDAGFTSGITSGTWTGAPILAGAGVSLSYTWTKIDPPTATGGQVCAAVTVSTTSPSYVAWSFDLDLTQPPWNGVTSGYTVTGGGTGGYVAGNRYRVSGTADPSIGVSATDPTVQTICNPSLPPIPASAAGGYYTVTTTRGTWTGNTACLVTTVTGNGKQPFYFLWTAPVDMSTAFARVNATRVQMNPADPLVTISPALSTAQSTYTITPTWPAAIKGTGTYSVTVCAYKN